MNAIKKILSVVMVLFYVLGAYGQTVFTERAILSDRDNFSEIVFEKVITNIEESDSTYIVKSQDGLELYLKRVTSTYRLIGDEYDIITLDSSTKYGFCSSEIVEDSNSIRYKLQDRFYSKSKTKWIGDYELFFLFKHGKNDFPNGERIIFKRWIK